VPCCISKNRIKHFGDTTIDSIETVVNSEPMKELRINMLTEKYNSTCQQCYAHEQQNIRSFRKAANLEYSKYFDETVPSTLDDGSITDFKMRYFDIRFSNICNFKCRTCGPEYSSQWEMENKKNNFHVKIIPKNNRAELLSEVLTHVQHMESAYFAGGEPLITEEHYVMLEEMIRCKRTDIRLSYNTNLSNFKFKDKDLLGLWKNFTNGVFVNASLDHFGERAEYIRHGTDWSIVESNLQLIKSLPYIHSQINTVVSLYNYYTIDEFYNYLISNGFYSSRDMEYTLYNMQGPIEFVSQVLPQQLKEEARLKIIKLKYKMKALGFGEQNVNSLDSIVTWAEADELWNEKKDYFRKEVARVDRIRGESFSKTFPELAQLLDD
jgi:MoaA/NifB/PqqE/SkfB family radical SAM enzyme